MPAEKRKIGGHYYRYMEMASTMTEANKRADWWRSKGSQGVRIMPFRSKHSIYIRTSGR